MVRAILVDQKAGDPLAHQFAGQHRVTIEENAFRIGSRRADAVTGKPHRLLGDRLRLAQVRQFLLRFCAAIQNGQLWIVLHVDPGLPQVRSKNHRQRAVGTNAINAVAPKTLRTGLRQCCVAVS